MRSSGTPPGTELEPRALFDVELAGELPALGDAAGGRRRGVALVRLHGRPLGLVDLALPAPPAELAAQLARDLAGRIRDHLRGDQLPDEQLLGPGGIAAPETPPCLEARRRFLDHAPSATVVVATRDRPGSLAVALDSLLALRYPHFEIVVVDSAPTTDGAFEVVRERRQSGVPVRYVRAARPGLAVAHNHGLDEAGGTIVAFADDDVVVDPNWLTELAHALTSCPHAACATGLILPAELETPAQVWLERYARLNKGFERRVHDLGEHRLPGPLYPYTTGLLGSGASMAFEAAALRALGGFDPATGAGTPARGGDDLLAFFRVLRAGHAVVYEPAAILWHAYRRDVRGLSRQMFGYGAGLTAYLAGTVAERPSTLLDLLRRAPRGLAYGLGPSRAQRSEAPFERALIRSERLGMLYGPFGYLLSRWQGRAA